jgi:hypothetical protein
MSRATMRQGEGATMTSRRSSTSLSKLAAATVLACLGVIAGAATGEARPTYFDHFKTHYGITEDSRLNACGVCHIRWLGTGARNLFGTTVEQQLYLGKTIDQALDAAGVQDPDGDGYTSADEIINYLTLPGYNCSNFTDAQGAPDGYDTYITPLVATCLEPLDIRVSPTTTGAILLVGQIKTLDLEIINNGSTDPLNITSYDFAPGAPPSLSVSGPAAPLVIPVGQKITVQITFAPTAAVFSNTALRIVSDDPDENPLDVPIIVFASPNPTVPGPQRAPCYDTIRRGMSKYAKAQLRAWSDCQLAELAGLACDTGARDLKVGKAASRFSAVVGGAKDKTCAAAGLTAQTLGFPGTCAAGCEDHPVTGVSDIPGCLMCVQDLVMQGVLRDGAGTAPPDLPPNVISASDALSCQGKILSSMQKSFLKMYSALSACELDAMLNENPGGACESALSTELGDLRLSLDAVVGKCANTDGLLGCRFEGMIPDPLCLGHSVEDLAVELSDASFGVTP